MAGEHFKIRIDGRWSAAEMSDLFGSCDAIYGEFAKLLGQKFHNKYFQQTQNPEPSGNGDGRDALLIVTSVSYSSPGWADFLGAGELSGHLKDFLLGLIDRVLERKDRAQGRELRAAEIESATLENYSKQLELIDQALDLAERRNLNDGARRSMLNTITTASRPLAKAIADGRITAVEGIEN